MPGSVGSTVAHIKADVLIANHEIALVMARVQFLVAARDRAIEFLERHSKNGIGGQYEDLVIARQLSGALKRFKETAL